MIRINKLDGLRGVFCMFVVFFHYDVSLLPTSVGSNFIIRQSESFVDFFFILSGYLISSNYESRLLGFSSFVSYLRNRFIRIYPMLFFSTCVFFSASLFSTYFFPNLIHNSVSIGELIVQAQETLLLLNSAPILGSGLGLNFPTWSISSEMISYTLWGILILWTPITKRMNIFLVVLLTCFVFLAYQEKYFLTGTWGFVRGLYCFIMGSVVNEISKNNKEISSYFEWVLICLVILVLYFLHKTNFTIYREFIGLIFVPPLFSTFIFVLLKTNGLLSRLLETSPLRVLGKISYSIYLNHALIVVVVPRILFDFILIERTNINFISILILMMVILISYSYLTFYVIEKGLGGILKKLILKSHI